MIFHTDFIAQLPQIIQVRVLTLPLVKRLVTACSFGGFSRPCPLTCFLSDAILLVALALRTRC